MKDCYSYEVGRRTRKAEIKNNDDGILTVAIVLILCVLMCATV